MLTFRKFLRTLVGRATPVQVLLACVLGSLLGFLPITNGAEVAAVLAVVLLLVLDANIFLAGLVTAGTKLLSIASAPVAFAIGRILLDGPTQPLARTLVNGPVTAWLGFDSYLATGGIVLGLIVGIAIGIAVAGLVRRLRAALAGLETSSAAFQALMARRTVRWGAWVLFGGIPKGGFAAIAAKRGLPIRWSGAILGIVVLGLVVAAGWLLSGGAARDALAAGLERMNGATVDIDAVEIDWLDGRASIVGLAVCDPAALENDLLRAGRLTATLDLDALLRRRLAIDLVQVDESRIDAVRESPGRLAVPPTDREDETEPTIGEDGQPLPGGNLDEYLKTARAWKERLAQVRRAIEDIARRLPEGDGEGSPDGDDRPALSEGPAFEAWLREQIDLHGYAGVRASHLVEEAPRLLVRRIEATGIREPREDVLWDVEVTSISTEPRLVEEPASIVVRASDGSVLADVSLGGLAATRGDNRFDFVVHDLPSADIVGQLMQSADPPFQGGRIDATIAGTMMVRPTVAIDAPLEIILRNSTIRIGGESATIAELPVRFLVSGRLDDPRIRLDEKAFADALQKAGADALASKARGELESQIDRGLDNLKNKTGVEVPEGIREGIGKGLEGLFGGGGKKD